jgi:hypothetical protein
VPLNPEWTTLLILVTAHLLADFPLQPDSWVARKRHPGVFLAHTVVVGASAYVLLGDPRGWLLPLAILVAHAVIDLIKTLSRRPGIAAFGIDQAAHAATLVAAAWLLPVEAADCLWPISPGGAYLPILAVTTGVLLATGFSGAIVARLVQPFLLQLEAARTGTPEQRGFANGGRTIGLLERLLVFLFVLGGQPGAVGFLFAAKSVFRFGEIKERENRMEAEYILIGTMLSFLLALLSGLGCRALLDLLTTP